MGSITDVPGVSVGQAERTDDGWLSGVTVVLPPEGGAVAGVDVRGGGPGTRETDLLDPRNLVERIHALVFTGGSALGLAAVDGVVQRLLDGGVGFEVGEPGSGEVVPVVPAAVIFDLGRGGEFRHLPGPELGAAAYDAASSDVREGNVGAGTGARVGGLKGGVGTVSATLPDGTTVGALAVVNAAGSAVDLTTGELYAARHCRPGDVPALRRPDPAELEAAKAAAAADPAPRKQPLATTLVAVATDATLTKAQCQKVSGIGHDGLARAINPVHTMFDGDTVFTLATCARAAETDPLKAMEHLHALLEAAGDCVTRAVARAVLAAESTHRLRSYREAFPSAFA
jgi:L-aminopeptidase/D-esterase-like protein